MQTGESRGGCTVAIARELLSSGIVAGAWRIEHLLGRGGMGDVYAVVHEHIGKRAAMKVLHRRFTSVVDVDRIRLEGQVVNQVGHPNIVDIFEAGTVDGRPYLVMEKLTGLTLGQLAASTQIEPARVIQILSQVCHAIAAAHGAGVIHRDLKPDNIFLTSTIHDGHALHVKVLDWGIAKVLGDTARRTTEGQVVGTPDYLAPEQACGRPVSPQTDVYALGVIAYQLFLDQLPFAAKNPLEMLKAHFQAIPRPPRELWPEMPARLETLVLAMLAKEPRDRPTIINVFETLQQVKTELGHGSMPSCANETPSLEPARVSTAHSDAHALTVQAEASVRRVRPWELALLFVGMVVLLCVALSIARTIILQRRDTSAGPRARLETLAPAPSAPAADAVMAANSTIAANRPDEVADTKPPPNVAAKASLVARPRAVAARPRVEATPLHGAAPIVPPADSATVLASRYISVGRELKVHGDARDIDVADLWSRYRRIRFNQALATPETRSEAALELAQIQDEILDRCAP